MNTIRTIGHGTLAADELARLIADAGIEIVVDVRRYPGSRRHPHFAGEEMATWLQRWELGYRWMPSLGGRRTPVVDSPNIGLRNEQFRGYADHMASQEFADGVAELVGMAAALPVVAMCAESVWWRCHRRLVADHLVLMDGVAVEHLFHDGRLVEHQPTPQARRTDGHVIYDVGVERPLLADG